MSRGIHLRADLLFRALMIVIRSCQCEAMSSSAREKELFPV
jgi:hypothetical protein